MRLDNKAYSCGFGVRDLFGLVCVGLKRVECVDVYEREGELGSESRLHFCVEV